MKKIGNAIVPMLAAAVFGFSACTSSNKTSETNTEALEDSLDLQVTPRPLITENPDPAHNSQNSVDWMGTYEATLPCADCPGIKTVITLKEDETFVLNGEYLERDATIEDEGTFEWEENGSVVHLIGRETNVKLKVGENRLFQLDQDGKEISGPLTENYIFRKQL